MAVEINTVHVTKSKVEIRLKRATKLNIPILFDHWSLSGKSKCVKRKYSTCFQLNAQCSQPKLPVLWPSAL